MQEAGLRLFYRRPYGVFASPEEHLCTRFVDPCPIVSTGDRPRPTQAAPVATCLLDSLSVAAATRPEAHSALTPESPELTGPNPNDGLTRDKPTSRVIVMTLSGFMQRLFSCPPDREPLFWDVVRISRRT